MANLVKTPAICRPNHRSVKPAQTRRAAMRLSPAPVRNMQFADNFVRQDRNIALRNQMEDMR